MKNLLIGVFTLIALVSCVTPGAKGPDLHEAAKTGNVEMVQQALLNGTPVNARANSGHAPLHWAIINGHKEVIDVLLDGGADISQPGPENISSLTLAVIAMQFDIAHYLIERGADNSQEELNKTLWTSVHFKLLPAAQFTLFELGAIPESDSPILLLAIMNNQLALVEPLLDRGANPLVREGRGRSVLRYAGENAEIVSTLVSRGADVNNIPNDGIPPISSMAMQGNLEMVQLYLEYGAEVNPRYSEPKENRRTPLPPLASLGTAKDNTLEIARILLDAGADINYLAFDDEGKSLTPIIVAILNKNIGLTRFLLSEGADPFIQTGWGTPAEVAKNSDNPQMIELFD